MEETKICYICKQELPLSEFSSKQIHCKDCHRIYEQARLKNDPIGMRLRYLLNSARTRAKQKNVPFDIDLEYLIELCEKQDCRCYYTGERIKFKTKILTRKEQYSDPYSPSIDRIIPEKGYIRGNIALCYWQVNQMKGQLMHDELIEWCKKVINNGDRAISV